MADNVIIRFTADTSDLKTASADLQQLTDREKDIQNEMRKQQAEYQKQLATIQATVKGRENQIAAIDKLRAAQTKLQQSLETELKSNKANMESFAKGMQNVNDKVADSAVKTPKLVTQLRAMKQELAKMEMEGVSPSDKAFVRLAVSAGKLEDQIGDTRSRIAILSSDTKNLDAAMGAGQGLAGVFSVATSATALLGGENEELQKAFFKVQAVMSILNGVNAVAVALNKDQALSVVVGTAVQESNTIAKVKNYTATKLQTANTILETAATNGSKVAKVGATVTQWALNAAVSAFPIVLLVTGLAAIVAGFVAFSNNAAEAERAQARLNAESANFSDDMKERSRLTQYHTDVMKANGKTQQEITEYEIKRAKENKAYYDQQYAFLQRNKNADKDAVEEARKNAADAATILSDLNNRKNIEFLQAKAEADKKKQEADKKANEDEKQRQKEHNAYMLNVTKQLEDSKIALMKDGIDKQVALINNEYDRKIAAIKGNSEKEIQLRESLELEKLKKIQDLNKVFELKRSKDAFDVTTFIEKGKSEIIVNAEKSFSTIINKSIDKQSEREIKKKEATEKKKTEIAMQSIQLINEIGNLLFDARFESIQAETDALNNYYTTDAEEAKKNSDLKYITAEELAKKQLELKQKQAKADKEQALFNIAMNTAQAVMSIWAQVPKVDFGVSAGLLTAFAVALGAAQAIAVASKPLPKYAQGKKADGGGHFATVGELGAETMWIPDGAAVIPHNRPFTPKTFSEFGIPMDFDSKLIRGEIDYTKLGKAVADNVKIPTPKPVTVYVDNGKVTTNYGRTTTTHLNKKYNGSW